MSAYVEFYEPNHPDDPSPEGCYAMCGECGWDGPHRDTITEAQADADVHSCVAARSQGDTE